MQTMRGYLVPYVNIRHRCASIRQHTRRISIRDALGYAGAEDCLGREEVEMLWGSFLVTDEISRDAELAVGDPVLPRILQSHAILPLYFLSNSILVLGPRHSCSKYPQFNNPICSYAAGHAATNI